MSTLKRKGAPSGNASKKDSPSKKVKSEKPADKASEKKTSRTPEKKTSKSTDKTASSAPSIARVKEEEPLFPRGGGSVLTPLEHKQITIQAKQDALFEEESGKATKKGDKDSKKKKRKSSGKDDKKSDKPAHDPDAVKIEGLNYKRLVKGSLVLGQVCDINDLEIAVALPNNLVGHVSITSVSPGLTKRIEAAAAADDSDGDEEEATEDDVDLKTLFEVGQYVRAYVVSTVEDSSALPNKSKRRIELSLRPEDTNSTITTQELVANSTVMAAVASVEDHGYVMDLGLAETKVTGFLPKKEVDPATPEERLQPGSVFLCMATGLSGNRKVVQLTSRSDKMASPKSFPSDATTVDTFTPGTAVDVLVSEVSERGIIGKVLGHLDVTADHVHSGVGPHGTDLEAKYKVGSKLRARVICTFPDARQPKLGISILDHVLALQAPSARVEGSEKKPLDALAMSSVVENCVVKRVEADIGLFVDVGVKGVPGFVHISRVKDGKIDALYESSGPYKLDSVHRGRVVGYNAFDGLFLLSFQKSVLEQPFLRVEDVPVGAVVDGVVEKIVVGENGVHGVIVQIAEGISGLVPEMHLSDVRLQHPEKKFKVGLKVKARVLSTDPYKRQLRLTLKKTLVNSDATPIKTFDEVSIGMQVLGTIINVLQNGAVVQFYGRLRGFLPLSEMSEAYIQNPKEHFRQGQVVNVHVIDVDADTSRLIVSCKDPSAFGMDKQLALKNLSIGDVVSGKVSQKTEDDVFVELQESLLKAVLPVGQLTDKSQAKNLAALKRIYVGQTLTDLAVLEKNEGRRALTVTLKPSLVEAAKKEKLPSNWDMVKVGDLIHGFVRNVTPTAVFVQFGGNATALLPAAMIPQEQHKEKDFGLQKLQSIPVKVVSVDRDHSRAVVAIPSVADAKEQKSTKPSTKPVENPVDDSIKSEDDIVVGRITKAKIISIKSTQLNVQADNLQGRVDVSQVFDSWDEIRHSKNPLQKFKPKQTIKVKVLGVHDARNHRFLPISHRSTHSLIELSARPSDLKEEGGCEPLSLEQITEGSEWVGFVNNIKANYIWVNLSPSVRGRMAASDASDDLAQLGNLSGNFPIGCAVKVRVKAVEASKNRLDLTARSSDDSNAITWDNIKKGLVLPGKVTKVTDRSVMVQLSEDVSAPVHLVDLADDYDDANPKNFTRNEIVRVAVVDVDASNKKIRLSTRSSRVLNSALPVKDREITVLSGLKTGDIVRGFVRHVADQGLFVNLGGHVTAFVKITDLSDIFLKRWKEHFRMDQLVKGRVIAVDPSLGQVNLSLKASLVENDYVPPRTLADFEEGEVVKGKVRRVEDFGAFIVIDGSANVSGLCHRSQMAEKNVKDARKLYSAGDVVKARIMKIDSEKKQISFGLKASYFEDGDEEDSDADNSDDETRAALDSDAEDDSDEDDEFMDAAEVLIQGTDNVDDSDEEDEDTAMVDASSGDAGGLDAGGFDWSAGALDEAGDDSDAEASEADDSKEKKKKKRKAEIQVDRTAQLDVNGPQTAEDYERLLLGQPDSSDLWIRYMAFQVQVSEPARARELAERALKTINIREEAEKLNVWIAYLNLENNFGTDDTLAEVFKRACQYNDEQVVHERLINIYIITGKQDKADELYQAMIKKFGAKSPQVWTNYANFLHNTVKDADRARALVHRATQRLPSHTHVPLMTKFASLEFRSASGDAEHGRTVFEGILSAYPKKFDLWNQLLDLEISAYNASKKEEDGNADPTHVREVFERGTKTKGLKPLRAKKWFQRWAKWEEENGDAKNKEKVMAKATEWTREAEARKQKGEEDDEE